MKFKLAGDICHPGFVEIEAQSIEDLLGNVLTPECNRLNQEDFPFKVVNEQSRPLLFVWDGPIFDENDKEVKLPADPGCEAADETFHPWTEDTQYPVADWRHEVANDDTRLGYLDWVKHQREAANAG